MKEFITVVALIFLKVMQTFENYLITILYHKMNEKSLTVISVVNAFKLCQ